METIKSFISHLLVFVFFVAISFLGIAFISDKILNYDTIYNALEDSDIIKKAVDNNVDLQEIDIPDKLVEYSKIEEIFNDYISNRTLYEFKIINNKPVIYVDEVNNRLGDALEKYIDDELNKYTGGLHSFLVESGIDLGLEEEIKKYLSDQTSIDLMNNEIVNENDVQKIYEYVDTVFADVNKNGNISKMISIINNKNYRWYAVGIIIICIILIALINFSFTSLFGYLIAPTCVSSVIYLVGYILTTSISFKGRLTADVLNVLEKNLSNIFLEYMIVFILITIVLILLYYISKNIRIAMFHKKGVATLDTIFDDYNIDEVLKEMNESDTKVEESNDKTKKRKKSKKNSFSKKNKSTTKTSNTEENK